MKKNLLLSAMMLSAALVGCSSSTETTPSTGTTNGTPTQTTTISGTVNMGGSTSVAEVVGGMMEVYMAENAGVDIIYSPTGSSTGVQGAIEGTLDLGLSSRELKDTEKESVEEIVFALDGIAVIVNTENGVTDLTMEQLAQIINREVTDWSEVGGAAGTIVTVGRDSASGTRDGFESILGVTDVVYDDEQSATGAVIAMVSSNTNAIGYISLSAVDSKVATVSIDGIAPSADTVLEGSYALQRPFVFAADTDNLSDVAQAFLNWAISENTHEIMLNAGVIPAQ